MPLTPLENHHFTPLRFSPFLHIRPLELFPQLPPPSNRPPHRSPIPLTAPLSSTSMVDGRPAESTERVSLKKVSDTLWTFTIKGMVAGDCGTYTVNFAMGRCSFFKTTCLISLLTSITILQHQFSPIFLHSENN